MIEISSQKYIGENRAPRVQIVYDVEVDGESRSFELPFVMGVLGDFSGHDSDALPSLNERRFLDIDATNFDRRLHEITPSLFLNVKNRLSEGSQLPVELKFKKMEDFRPDQIARQILPLASLLEAREKLSALLAYMDGKAGAEDLLWRVLQDRSLLRQISEAANVTSQGPGAKVDE